MTISRRTLLALPAIGALMQRNALAQTGIPLDCLPPIPSGAPVNFAPPTNLPMRTRKSAFELDAAEVKRLRDAYAALRNLTQQSPGDARGWQHQGLAHCWYCSGSIDGLNGQEIHGGWWFLPWHRAYLFFHEMILGTLLGDPTFALPYWDWDTPGRNTVPDAYGKPGDASNPLFDTTRVAKPGDKIPDGSGAIDLVGPRRMQSVLGSRNFDLFGGSGEGGSGSMGALEGAPHGGVHLWSTDPVKIDPNNPQIDMGVLATAALDPIFFAHHANIDRLWAKWNASDPSHTNPTVQNWQQWQFLFYDQTSQWTAIATNQVVDTQATLRYQYLAPRTGAVAEAAPAAPPQPAALPAAVTLAQAATGGPPVVDLSQTSELKPLTPNPTTVQIAVPAAARETLAAAAARSVPRLVLHVDGVQVPPDRGALVKVYLNNPDATAATLTSDPSFVGSMVIVPAIAPGSRRSRPDVLRNFTFDLSALSAASLNAGANVSVTLVPVQGEGVKPDQISVGFRRVYVTEQ
jgi:polyphenol oxidase